jgi:uncharacterized protein YndB with AHSA1/START domain
VVIRAQTEIARSPEDVFDYCSDHRHEPEWNPLMRRADMVTDGPVGIGTRYSVQFAKGAPMLMECVRYQRPESWSVVGNSKSLAASGEGHAVAQGGGALLLMRMELEPHGLLRRRMQQMWERDIANVKTKLEAGPATE